ncbi:hypothetical protein, partial [Bradyrhizobium sp.]|uniref:hypothetical protein n=1 Tax=Bradyrhizobium sp. TaxID=376 RepID=UPI003C4C02BB
EQDGAHEGAKDAVAETDRVANEINDEHHDGRNQHRLKPSVLFRQKHSSSPQHFQDFWKVTDGTAMAILLDATSAGTERPLHDNPKRKDEKEIGGASRAAALAGKAFF